MTEPLAKRLLLVGWDAADWQLMHPLIDAGRMPHLGRLVEGAVEHPGARGPALPGAGLVRQPSGRGDAAFHPPRLPQVRTELFEVFRGVVEAIYEFHDQMLGRLLELAGRETHVMIVSDHGFHSGASRPMAGADPSQWHRNFGMFLLAGPGVRQDATVHGATLLDITPTVPTLFGLPAGRDMEGRVLADGLPQPTVN